MPRCAMAVDPEISEIQRLIAGMKDTQLLHVAAALSLPDRLANGPRSAADLAAELQVDAVLLRRVLRGLVNRGIVEETAPSSFVITSLGALLKTDGPRGLHGLALRAGSTNYEAWGRLLEGIQTGGVPFQLAHGRTFFDGLMVTPSDLAAFQHRLASESEAEAPHIVDAIDLSAYADVVDIGGGLGSLLSEILERYSDMRGVLLELPAVCELAREYLDGRLDSARYQVMAGDFFDAVPAADVHVLQTVLHDWDDTAARRILHVSRASIHSDGRLLIIEDLMPERIEAYSEMVEYDLTMLVGHGGRQRSATEFEVLLADSEYEVLDIIATESHHSVVTARPA